MNNPYNRLLTTPEAAALLNMSPRTLQRKVKQGEITSILCNRMRRFHLADLEEWQERYRVRGGRYNA